MWFVLNGQIHNILEFNRLARNDVHPSRVMDCWVLQFVLKGKRTVRLQNKKITASTGDFFLLPPHIPHYGAEIDAHDVIYFHFQMSGKPISTPQRIDTSSIMLPLCEKYPSEPDLISHVLFLLNHYHLKYMDSSFFTINLLSILSHLSLYSQRNAFWNKPHEILSDNIMNYIIHHFQENLSCAEFEQEFQMSYKQLNNIFREKYHQTIMRKFTEYRIQQASQLLLQGCSIAEASTLSGFSDYFYFLRVFKKVKGITPKEYIHQYFIANN